MKSVFWRLDGTYTRLLMRAQNIPHESVIQPKRKLGICYLCHPLWSVGESNFAGQCCRAENEIISNLVWKPASRNNRGRKRTYPDVISRDDKRTCLMQWWTAKSGAIWYSIVSNAVEQWWWRLLRIDDLCATFHRDTQLLICISGNTSAV